MHIDIVVCRVDGGDAAAQGGGDSGKGVVLDGDLVRARLGDGGGCRGSRDGPAQWTKNTVGCVLTNTKKYILGTRGNSHLQ